MTVIAFLFGLVTGSFLNVCIYRIPAGESIVYPPSHCPRCNTRLSALDLVPIVSWLRLGGKCAYCGGPISARYPAVELLTGVLFAVAWVNTVTAAGFIKIAVLFSLFVVVAFIDLDHQIIPDGLVLTIFLWGLFWQIVAPPVLWWQALAGGLLGGGILLVAAVLSKGGMGGGDIKLLAAAGFILGPAMTAIALFISVLAGSVVGVTLIATGIRKRKDFIPFGPFLSLGIMMAILWGHRILQIYLGWIGW